MGSSALALMVALATAQTPSTDEAFMLHVNRGNVCVSDAECVDVPKGVYLTLPAYSRVEDAIVRFQIELLRVNGERGSYKKQAEECASQPASTGAPLGLVLALVGGALAVGVATGFALGAKK